MSEEHPIRGKSCPQLVASGDIHLSKSFVRLSIFETGLENLKSSDSEDGSGYLGAIAIGLPVAFADDDDLSVDIAVLNGTSAGSVVQVLPDNVFLPGSPKVVRRIEVIQIHESQLSDAAKLSRRYGVRFSGTELRKLSQVGILEKARGAKRPALRFVLSRTSQVPNRQARTAITLNLPSEDVQYAILLNAIFFGLSNDPTPAFEAFIADTRSGDFFNALLPEHPGITELGNDQFNKLFEYLQNTFPNYLNELVNQTSVAAEWPQNRIGVATVFRQNHRLVQHHRGRLIESITLGPGETVTTEVKSWDRSQFNREENREIASERSAELETTSTLTVEFESEINNALSVGASGDLGGSLPIESIGVSLDASISPEVSSSMESSMANSLEQINQTTRKAAEKIKQSFQVKVSTTRDVGKEASQSRVLTNPNSGRNLNIHHFEVLAEYMVETEVEEVPQLVLEVGNPPLPTFDINWIRAHYGFLARTLRHQVYVADLSEVQKVAARDWFVGFAAEERQRQADLIEELERVRTSPGPNNSNTAGTVRKIGLYSLIDRLYDKFEKFELYNDPSALEAAAKRVVRHLLRGDVSTSSLRQAEQFVARSFWWHQFLLVYPAMSDLAEDFLNEYRLLRDKNSLTEEESDTALALVASLTEVLDDEWVMNVKLFGSSVFLTGIGHIVATTGGAILGAAVTAPAGTAAPLFAKWTSLAGASTAQAICMPYFTKLVLSPDDLGLPKTLSKARMDYPIFAANLNSKALSKDIPNATSGEDLISPSPAVPEPPRIFSDQEIAVAHAALERLTLHLEAHRTYYTNTFYKEEDPASRMERLRFANVARFVDNRILGFSGTRAIYPLRLMELPEKAQAELSKLVLKKDKIPTEDPFAVHIPTAGVVSEAILGECEVLEPFLVRQRELEIEEREIRLEHLRKELLPAP